jgi:membrane protein DedA with SNARE-associated domain
MNLIGIHVPANLGYTAMVLLVGGESAGLPIPGETSVLVAGALAARGDLSLPLVWLFAATAAIVGDNVGYLFGRHLLRSLMTGDGRIASHTRDLMARSEVFFRRHGGKTVFFGRWLPVLRVTAAWMAGASHMPWKRFAVANALGGIGWTVTMSTVGYLAGRSADSVVGVGGILGLVAVVLALAAHWGYRRLGGGDEAEKAG